MIEMELQLMLRSDATFGRGDGVAGLVDAEVEYEEALGLPFLRGRALKGLLVEECANLLYALSLQNVPAVLVRAQQSARLLFGRPGSTPEDDGLLRVGSALLPQKLRMAVEYEISNGNLTPADVLDSLTAIRRQTAVNEKTGTPDKNSLRALRVVLRETLFTARLTLLPGPQKLADELNATDTKDLLALLSASTASLHRAGLGRNRGRGRLTATLYKINGESREDISSAWETLLSSEQSDNIVQGQEQNRETEKGEPA